MRNESCSRPFVSTVKDATHECVSYARVFELIERARVRAVNDSRPMVDARWSLKGALERVGVRSRSGLSPFSEAGELPSARSVVEVQCVLLPLLLPGGDEFEPHEKLTVR
jgi:hypothetical protein